MIFCNDVHIIGPSSSVCVGGGVGVFKCLCVCMCMCVFVRACM